MATGQKLEATKTWRPILKETGYLCQSPNKAGGITRSIHRFRD
jgi:hypothetical protein